MTKILLAETLSELRLDYYKRLDFTRLEHPIDGDITMFYYLSKTTAYGSG